MLSKTNTSIIIVSFNPNLHLEKLVLRAKEISNHVIVVDNASQNVEWVKKICQDNEITFLGFNENRGIGEALNYGIKEIHNKDKEWFITFDQDSFPDKNLLDYYNFIIERENNIGLIGINVIAGKLSPEKNNVIYHESPDLITSGTLHSLKAVESIGEYNEKMFIDAVDYEYSLRAKLKGWRNFLIDNNIMQHTVGSPKRFNLGKLSFGSMNHSAFRQYYIVRNNIWFAKKYFWKAPSFTIKKLYLLLNRLIRTILIDDDKKNKLKRIGKGFIDGIKGNLN